MLAPAKFWLTFACLAAALCSVPQAALGDGPTINPQVDVNIAVVPIASLTIVGSDLLELTVPPSKSTVNTSGTVQYLVTGNAAATVTAEPDQFVNIPSKGWMGKAVLGAGAIGYQIQLMFPDSSVGTSFIGISTLPLLTQSGTVPPLTVPLPLTGGQRSGTIDLLASAAWTPDGGLPPPGVYVGQVVLTVTPGNL